MQQTADSEPGSGWRAILPMLSGLPREKRESRVLVTLQAYIDDSQEAREVLVLAGYVATAEQWAKFSDEWSDMLRKVRWSRFKMSEIAGGSTDRLERAGAFYRIIEDYALAAVAIAIEMRPLVEIVRELRLPQGFENPYIIGLRAITDLMAQHQHELGLSTPIDFIFDERREKKIIRDGFDIFRNSPLNKHAHMLGRDPLFENDDDFLPLQAADCFAWHARKQWVEDRSITKRADISMSWPKKRVIKGHLFNFDRKALHDNLTQIKLGALRMQGHLARITISVRFTRLDGSSF